ncbi:MAG: hypothetical protein CMF96_11500 [Candidatus Marinimicrobia bacterium]|nr:hypothetical protein [Candidatus Neomarinimicrobiota bacterium]
MARSYTPGLKVLSNTIITKNRRLPLKGKVLVKVGDKVDIDTIVASTEIPGNVQMVNVAKKLNIDPDIVNKCMLVKIDDKILKGQIIAESKGLFGFFKSELKSPIDGTVANISDVTGQVILSEPHIPIEINAYASGNIKSIINEEGVVISSEGALIQGILGIGGENQGIIQFVVDLRDEVLTADKINENHKNKIIIGGSFLEDEAFIKAKDIGVSGIVVGGFNYESLSKILGYNLGVAITGSEELGTSLMITEGFGEIAMAKRTFDIFKHFENKTAVINGSTQIRAGVIRPEVIIPNTDENENNEFKEEDMIISEGSFVRVIRTPFFGMVGTVIELPSGLTKLESETEVRIAKIKFENGDEEIIPRANLEMILS